VVPLPLNPHLLAILKGINHVVWNEVRFNVDESSIHTLVGRIDVDVHVSRNGEILSVCFHSDFL
jgi:hypothetical protein